MSFYFRLTQIITLLFIDKYYFLERLDLELSAYLEEQLQWLDLNWCIW